MFLVDPKGDGFDVIFEVVAHEMGHQWWGMQLKPAFAEGGGVISEGLAWYSTMQLVKNLYSRDRKRDYQTKIREAKLAEQLENIHTGAQGKNWVLTKYLNVVPYGTTNGTTFDAQTLPTARAARGRPTCRATHSSAPMRGESSSK